MKKKCFKTINSSRLFPVHRIRWLFFGSQFISHSIYHRCWTMFNTLRKVIHSFTLRFHSKLWSMEHRTWLCICVFWAKIPNLCDQTIHQSWHVAFMPKKKVFDFCNEDFRENQFEPQKWMWNWWCSIEICMFEQMAKSERHLFLWNNVLFLLEIHSFR